MGKKPLIDCIIGTRPDVIKMAPVIHALKKEPTRYRIRVISAGQHGGLHDRACAVMGITPDRNMRLLRPGISLTDALTRTIAGFGTCFDASQPDLVIVQGDTTTALGAAQAAHDKSIPVAHVEAGLRTDDPANPYPEEQNRRTITSIAALHFAPTKTAAANLKRENIPAGRIAVTGNTVVDALHAVLKKHPRMSRRNLRPLTDGMHPYLVCTLHRRENQHAVLTRLAGAVRRIAETFPGYRIVLPLHPNPAVTVPLKALLQPVRTVMLIRPLDYTDMVVLLQHARLLLTDSGGLQEEAAVLGTPTLILRENTERAELLASGIGILAGTDLDNIVRLATEELSKRKAFKKSTKGMTIFGKGDAALKIERHIRAFLAEKLS